MTSVFTRIIQKELPAEVVYENEYVIVIKDIHPVAPVHLLIITKKEIPSIQEVKPEDAHLIMEMISAAQEVAHRLNIKYYRLITNHGPGAGQSVFHLHFHMISGKPSDSLIDTLA